MSLSPLVGGSSKLQSTSIWLGDVVLPLCGTTDGLYGSTLTITIDVLVKEVKPLDSEFTPVTLATT